MASTEQSNAPKSKREDGEKSGIERLKTVGGLAAVGIGVVAVTGIAIGAIIQNSSTASTIASAAGGVIATMVGAYFGVKVGTDQTKNASDDQKAEAAKAQVYALHIPPEKANLVKKEAEEAAANTLAGN